MLFLILVRIPLNLDPARDTRVIMEACALKREYVLQDGKHEVTGAYTGGMIIYAPRVMSRTSLQLPCLLQK